MGRTFDRKIYLLKLIANNKIDAMFVMNCFLDIDSDTHVASMDTKKYMDNYEKQKVRRKTHPSSIAFVRPKAIVAKPNPKNEDLDRAAQLGIFYE
jgi:hypothetical protein